MNCIGVRLGEICQEIYRYPTYYDIEYLDTGIPEIRGELITSDGSIDLNRQKWRFISKNTSSKFPRTVLREGDLVMSVRGTIGKIGLIPQEFVGANITANLIRISPNRLRVNERYLWRYMRSTEFINSLDNASSSTTIKTIKAPDLKDIRIPLPPLEEQKRIAEILDRAEELRSKRREAIAELDTLIQAIFLEMFGDPAFNPQKWPRIQLVDLCSSADEIKCGPFGTQLGKDEYTTEGVPLWGIKNVNALFKILTHEFLEARTAKRLMQYSIEPGDIVMTRKGTVGNCAVYPDSYPLGIMHSDLLRLRVSRQKCVPIFLSHQLHYSRDVERQLALISGGAIMPGINVTKLKSLEVLVPPLSLQKEFAHRVEAVEKLKTAHYSSLSELDALFASLQHRAFQGEL
jgi:type I restriction enzyme S subunit